MGMKDHPIKGKANNRWPAKGAIAQIIHLRLIRRREERDFIS